ncbi:excisionase family DNA-binding protein [Microbacterium resistens]|uniref:Excisionase family DNA-binding protein n=1 Tax=Microbacterium resistens TaxID=156977 RepID=A0ABY3RRC4_9MICO|nr:helix-turn-helix domain-containing protein [Microbacterium resistens]UGS26352.1 excisionase family DNA-binding protein [Microbacterium resistens]
MTVPRVIQKRELTVAEAAVATGKSVDTIYRWIRNGKLRATETAEGMTVRTDRLLEVAGSVRSGRPRVGVDKNSQIMQR